MFKIMYVSKSDHMKSFQCLNMFWNRGKKKSFTSLLLFFISVNIKFLKLSNVFLSATRCHRENIAMSFLMMEINPEKCLVKQFLYKELKLYFHKIRPCVSQFMIMYLLISFMQTVSSKKEKIEYQILDWLLPCFKKYLNTHCLLHCLD